MAAFFIVWCLEYAFKQMHSTGNRTHSGCAANDGTHRATDLLLFVRTFFLFQIQLFRHVGALAAVLLSTAV